MIDTMENHRGHRLKNNNKKNDFVHTLMKIQICRECFFHFYISPPRLPTMFVHSLLVQLRNKFICIKNIIYKKDSAGDISIYNFYYF